ncbi:uncharacterized protein LOC128965294 isoform X2 [Oppia nitens]|uniref:uncharacterized protein LOC128965294 isoform X2 n=1 Tax=Oppia nitens TaxID=1686743 RepID=UPI0023DA5F45|nr:uncharacterized protein LOC128965294 isoform X2 [Oppia nitens]
MSVSRKSTLITLRRSNQSQPWGFRLAGGVNQGQPFMVQKVIPDSIAHKCGLQEEDLLVRIGNITLKRLTHEEVQEIIIRCISTIDLFIIRTKEPEELENENPILLKQTEVKHIVYTNTGPNVITSGTKCLTDKMLNQLKDDNHYKTNYMVYNNPSSPPMQPFYVTEREMFECREYSSSPSQSKSPSSGHPYSPVMSPTIISYYKPEEQQWSTGFNQPRDTRVFATGYRPQSKNRSPNSSNVINGELKPTQTSSATPSPTHEAKIIAHPPPVSPPPVHDMRQMNIITVQQNKNQKSIIKTQGKQFFGRPNQRSEFNKPETHRSQSTEDSREVKDKRVFANNTVPRLQRLGSWDESKPHWKTPLPKMVTGKPEEAVNQLLPSQARKQQTYIVQTPPTEKNWRPPPTGSSSRKIRPVWPPLDHNQQYVSKTGFDTSGRESPVMRYEWRAGSVDNGIDNRMRQSTPPPGRLQQTWNPRSGSVTPPPLPYLPSRRVRGTAWPPPSNATPAGCTVVKIQSLPGSRRSSQDSDFYPPIYYHSNNQYGDQSYHYDTD